MGSTQERIKKRREYLKQKGAAYSTASLAALLTIPCALGTFFLVAVTLFVFFYQVSTFFGLLLAFLSLIGGVCSWQLARSALHYHKAARQLPYVPPVTPETLPAGEVLVRGSEEPKQEQSKVLLRGTDGSAGTADQELLRSSQGQE